MGSVWAHVCEPSNSGYKGSFKATLFLGQSARCKGKAILTVKQQYKTKGADFSAPLANSFNYSTEVIAK